MRGNLRKRATIHSNTFQGDQLSEEAKQLCGVLSISPDDLKVRTFDSFAEKGVSEKIQRLRFEHYLEKRDMRMHLLHTLMIQNEIHNTRGTGPNKRDSLLKQISLSPKYSEQMLLLTSGKNNALRNSKDNSPVATLREPDAQWFQRGLGGTMVNPTPTAGAQDELS